VELARDEVSSRVKRAYGVNAVSFRGDNDDDDDDSILRVTVVVVADRLLHVCIRVCLYVRV